MNTLESVSMRTLIFSSLALAACSGGGSDAAATAPGAAGSIQVVVDTASGSDALVQFQVVAAVLETASGVATGNLLAAPKMLTLADPMGETDGLVLDAVPTGSYSTLRLGIAPGSGVALYPTGTTVPVSTAFEITVPFPEALAHDATRSGWVVCSHVGTAPATAATATFAWMPMLLARSSETRVALVGLDFAITDGVGLTVTAPGFRDAPLYLSFDANCSFQDDHGNAYQGRDDFLRISGHGDVLHVEGRLHRDGRFDVDHVRRRGGRGHGERLIGRITQLQPATDSFIMDVLAVARRGERSLLAVPSAARVLAANARIERSGTRQYLPFSVLAVDQLVKVQGVRPTTTGNGLAEIEAREIEVSPAGGVAMRLEWEGRVAAVDLQQRTITVVPRNNDPIIVHGHAQDPVTVNVGLGVPIERRPSAGGGPIALDQIMPGQDRIWWRGTVTAPAAIDATWVRVRDDG